MLFNNREEKRQEVLHNNFYKTFNNSYGREVLIYLKNLTINKVLPNTATTGELYYLEGQRSIIKLIENYSK